MNIFVYLQDIVGDETLFINKVKEILVVHFKSCWLEDMGQNNPLMTYTTFKSLLDPELYFNFVLFRYLAPLEKLWYD